MLTKGELHNGAEYFGSSRIALNARWDATLGKFKLICFKYGYFFIEELTHPEDTPLEGDAFRPMCLLSEVHDRLAK